MSKICFIVGHGKSRKGGYDSGAVSGNYHEFKIAREITKYAQAYYNANYTETADIMNYNGDLYLTDRIKKVNAADYDFIAEIHLNAGKGTGSEVYYYHGSPTGEKQAEAISKAIAQTLGIRNRGAKVRLNDTGKDYFAIIRDTKPCAVLVETVFIDTASELAKVKTADGQKKCGEAIAQAVAQVRGLKKKQPLLRFRQHPKRFTVFRSGHIPKKQTQKLKQQSLKKLALMLILQRINRRYDYEEKYNRVFRRTDRKG